MAMRDDTSLRFLGSVAEEPGQNLRFMKRRKMDRTDRNGDPLEGIVNLFDVSLVLAVGFLVMALSGLGISSVLTSEKTTIVTNPGTSNMQVIVKNGDQIKKLDMSAGPEVAGVGSLLGSFYQLADGTVVYVPAQAGGTTTTSPTPSATPYPEATATPTPGVTTTSTPTPGVTLTPGTAP